MAIIEIKCQKDLVRLRRLALAAQGLLQLQPYGHGLAGARKAINHIGYVQIDTISVVERAHNHVFHSRVPDFKPSMTNQLLLNGDIFEYWTHAAAFLPIADFASLCPTSTPLKMVKLIGIKHLTENLCESCWRVYVQMALYALVI